MPLYLACHTCILYNWEKRDFQIIHPLNWTQCPSVEQSDDKVGGVLVFKDTRVPVKALFENLESGATIDDFLEWFPGVNRDQVIAVLVFAESSLASA